MRKNKFLFMGWLLDSNRSACRALKDPRGLAPRVNKFGGYGGLAVELLPLPHKAAGAVSHLRQSAARILFCLLSLLAAAVLAQADTPAKVELQKVEPAGWRLRVNGADFVILGAGGAVAPGLLEKLKEAGGNCVRTWSADTLEAKVTGGARFLDRAHQLGLMVVPGLWVEHERHGFNYADAAKVQRQREKILAAVRQYKNHPAVLMWGLGNEAEGPASPTGSVPVFKEIEALAKLIKQEDPAHPVMSVIAFNAAKVENVKRHCPSLDILGVNSYGGAAGAGEALKRSGWTKPFAVTEFGVRGPWEVPTTAWGAPLEPTSHEKARTFYATQRLVTELNDGKEQCLGTFAFLWGWKQERTATWFGLFLPTLEKLSPVDAMTRAWTGQWPAQRCPEIRALNSAAAGKEVQPGQTLNATLEMDVSAGAALTYDWLVVAESSDIGVGGDAEAAPPAFPDLVKQNNSTNCTFVSPAAAGNYRLFVTVHDGKGGAATANFPFRVAP
jgi:hypothetical protein